MITYTNQTLNIFKSSYLKTLYLNMFTDIIGSYNITIYNTSTPNTTTASFRFVA